MQHYEELASYQRDGFLVIVDKTWEDIPLRDCFDDSCYDIAEMEQRVNSCDLDWFMLRVRVMLAGHELGSHYLGGCLYEDARECLTDGTAEDCIQEALHEARREVLTLRDKLATLTIDTQSL
jgi:hypothetical protein